MKMGLEQAAGPVITGFSPRGGFKVKAGTFEGSYTALTITPAAVAAWVPPPLAALTLDDLAVLLALDPVPEFLILGTGPTMLRPSPAFIAAVDAKGIGVEPMDSRAAARAWAVLRGEGRWIVGALYPL